MPMSNNRAVSGDSPKPYRRRSLLLALGCASSWVVPTFGQTPTQKLSQAQAQYQATPKDIRSCGSCSLFQPPNRCKVVEGFISKSGWCKLYVAVD